MTEGVDDTCYAPAVLVSDGPDFSCPCSNGAAKRSIRVLHGQHDADRTSTERFGAEVEVLGRLVSNPEVGPCDRQTSYDPSIIVLVAKTFDCPEGFLVEVHGTCPMSDRQHRGDGGPDVLRRGIAHCL